jgi:hypothetical protein
VAEKLFLHIGLHKTGTSAIQHALYHAHDRLRAESVLYPKSVAWHDHSHHSLLLPFWREEDYGAQFDLLESEVRAAACKTLILSSELFPNTFEQERRFPALWERVSRLADEIEVILYVRRQDHLAASVFKQWCKSDDLKLAMSPQDFIADDVRINMDFEKYCRVWSALPKVTKLYLRSYDQDRGDLLGRFIGILGLPHSILDGFEGVRANPTLDGEQLIFRHYFNGFDLPQETSDALLAYLLEHLPAKPVLDIFTTDERRGLVEKYAASNEAAFATFAPPGTGFGDDYRESGHRFRTPTTPEVLDFFVRFAQFDKRLAAHLFDHVTGHRPTGSAAQGT